MRLVRPYLTPTRSAKALAAIISELGRGACSLYPTGIQTDHVIFSLMCSSIVAGFMASGQDFVEHY
jgi:hypothetical protein